MEEKEKNQKEKIDYTKTLEKFFEFFKESPPLFLPTGSIRAIMSLGLIALASILLLNGAEIPEWLSTGISMMIGFYFGTRVKNQ